MVTDPLVHARPAQGSARGALLCALILAAGWPASRLEAQGSPPSLVVRSLHFTGNTHISDGDLRAAIATTQSSFIARVPVLRGLGLGESPRFDESEFRRDVLRIQALYGVRGFPDVQVDTALSRSGGHVDIDVHITENAPVRVTRLSVRGISGIAGDRELRAALPLAVGAPFDRLAYRSAQLTIRGILHDHGYAFASVARRFQEDTAAKTVQITYDVDPGPQAVVGGIDIVGAKRIDDRVILQTMTIRPGQPYSEQALYDSQLALFRTNLFTYVNVSLTDTSPPTADSIVTVRVRAHVTEGPLRVARIGVGYGTQDCFRARAGLQLLNFTGGGRSLDLSTRLSQIGTGDPLNAGFEHGICPALADEDPTRLKLNYHVGATLREPLLAWRRVTASVSAFAERHTEAHAYLKETVSGELSATVDLGRHLPLTVTYALSYGKTEADPASFCIFLNICRLEDTRVFTRARPRSELDLDLSHNTTGSLLNPRSGIASSLTIGWASRLIGSDTLMQFLRGQGEVSSYHGLGGGAVLAWRIRAGAVVAPQRQLANGPERFVPPEERFYAGGANSVRGFSQNGMGPLIRVLASVDTTGDTPDSVIRTSAVGGNQLLLGNLELRFPLTGLMGGLNGLVFADAGLLPRRGDFTLSDVRVTPGIGVRLTTIIGPVGLDLGFNPYPVQTSPLYAVNGSDLTLVQSDYRPQRSLLSRFHLHFSIGQSF